MTWSRAARARASLKAITASCLSISLEGAEYLHRSLVVRTPNIGGAENGACFPYPPLAIFTQGEPRLAKGLLHPDEGPTPNHGDGKQSEQRVEALVRDELASPRVRLERLEDIEEVARPLPRDLMRGPRTRRRRNRIVA